MKDEYSSFGVIASVISLVALLLFAVAMKISVWNECRIDHSWWYCLHLISGR